MARGGGAGAEATVSIMGSGHIEIPPVNRLSDRHTQD